METLPSLENYIAILIKMIGIIIGLFMFFLVVGGGIGLYYYETNSTSTTSPEPSDAPATPPPASTPAATASQDAAPVSGTTTPVAASAPPVAPTLVAAAANFMVGEDDIWDFFPGRDSGGNDSQQLAGQTVPQIKAWAANHPEIVAFNTNGWMKTSVAKVPSIQPVFTDRSQGLYIRKSAGIARPPVAVKSIRFSLKPGFPSDIIAFNEVQVMSGGSNVASQATITLNQPWNETEFPRAAAVDGNFSTAYASKASSDAFYTLTWATPVPVDNVIITNRDVDPQHLLAVTMTVVTDIPGATRDFSLTSAKTQSIIVGTK